jgi:hypothetical protein
MHIEITTIKLGLQLVCTVMWLAFPCHRKRFQLQHLRGSFSAQIWSSSVSSFCCGFPSVCRKSKSLASGLRQIAPKQSYINQALMLWVHFKRLYLAVHRLIAGFWAKTVCTMAKFRGGRVIFIFFGQQRIQGSWKLYWKLYWYWFWHWHWHWHWYSPATLERQSSPVRLQVVFLFHTLPKFGK